MPELELTREQINSLRAQAEERLQAAEQLKSLETALTFVLNIRSQWANEVDPELHNVTEEEAAEIEEAQTQVRLTVYNNGYDDDDMRPHFESRHRVYDNYDIAAETYPEWLDVLQELQEEIRELVTAHLDETADVLREERNVALCRVTGYTPEEPTDGRAPRKVTVRDAP